MTTKITANDVAGNPDLFNKTIKLPHSRKLWECMGYSLTGMTIKFSRLVDGGQLRDGPPWPRQINCYIDPDTEVKIYD